MADSWWSRFTDSDNWWFDDSESAAKAGMNVVSAVSGALDKAVPDTYETRRTNPTSYMDPRWTGNTRPATTEYVDTRRPRVAGALFGAAVAPMTKPVELGSTALAKAESYGYGRPMSVLAQATNRFNPLYDDGIQLSDFQRMWEESRSDQWEGNLEGTQAGISPGQQAWYNVLSGVWAVQDGSLLDKIRGSQQVVSLFHPAGLGMAVTGVLADQAAAAINPEPIRDSPAQQMISGSRNIYNDFYQRKLYGNTLFSVTTGATDTVYQIFGVGKGGDAIAVAAKRTAGLNTTIDSVRDVQKAGAKIMDHLLWEETGGAQGRWNRWGYEISKIAKSTSSADISENAMFRMSPRRYQLADMLASVSDPILVAKVWAADRGDRMAIASLMRDHGNIPWQLFDGRTKLQMQQLIADLPVMDDGTMRMLGTIYDQTLDMPGNEWFRSAYDSFLGKNPAGPKAVKQGIDPQDWGKYAGTAVNTKSVPISGPLGRMAAGMAERRTDAAMGRGIVFDGDGWVSQTLGRIGGSEPVTVMVQWVGGRRQNGMIDASSLNPNDWVDELLGQVGSIKFARGNRTFSFDRGGQLVTMNGVQWRTEAISRLSAASRQGKLQMSQVMRELESELISAGLHRFGIPYAEAKQLADLAIDGKNTSMNSLKEHGFFFDDAQNRVVIHPQTQRQLVDSYVTVPMGEIMREMRSYALDRAGQKGRRAVFDWRHRFDLAYETIQKYIRTEQLIRPSYVKNSILEPVGAQLAFEGIDSVFSLSKDAGNGLINYVANRGKSLGAGVKWASDGLRITGGRRINTKIMRLHEQRMVLESKLDWLEAMQQASGTEVWSPARRAEIRGMVDPEVSRIKLELGRLWRDLDVNDPGWRSGHDQPRLSDVRAQVTHLHRAATDPRYIQTLRGRLAISQVDDEMAFERGQALAQARAAAARGRLAYIDSVLDPIYGQNASRAAASTQRAQHRAYRELQYHEQRLAWAERMAAGETPPEIVDRINELERGLAKLRERRDRIAAKAAKPQTADVLEGTEVAPRTGLLDDLDRRIAEQERAIQDTRASQTSLATEQDVQEILRDYPERIAQIRADLGDYAPPARFDEALAAERDRLREHINYVLGMRKQYVDGEETVVRQLSDEMPKQVDVDVLDRPIYEIPEEELTAIRDRAMAALDARNEVDWLADNGAERIMSNPFASNPMNSWEYEIFVNHGIVPLDWAKRFLRRADDANVPGSRPRPKQARNAKGGTESEDFWLWLEHGVKDDVTDDMYRAAQTQGKEGELIARAGTFEDLTGQKPNRRNRKPLKQDEIDALLAKEASAEQVQKWVKNRELTPEQEAFIQGNYGIRPRIKRGSGRQMLYVPVRWARPLSTKGQEKALKNLIDEETEAVQNSLRDKAADLRDMIAAKEADVQDGLRDFDSELFDAQSALAAIDRNDPGLFGGELKGYGVNDPIPGPFNERLLLAERDKLLATLDRDAQSAVREFTYSGKTAALEEEIRVLEAVASDPDAVARIATLRDRMDEAARERLLLADSYVDPAAKIKAVQAEIDKIESKVGRMQAGQLRWRKVADWLAERRTQTEAPITLRAGDQEITVPGLFDPNDFGAGRRASFSADVSSRLTFDPGQASLANAEYLSMSHGSSTIMPTDPRYFTEVAYVANRHITGDDFMMMLLDGQDNASVRRWLNTPAGQEYMRSMNWSPEEMMPREVGSVADQVTAGGKVPVYDDGRINTMRRLLFQYFPTREARRLVANGEVTPTELQQALQSVPFADLSPVQGHAVQLAKSGQWGAVKGGILKGIEAAWEWLATKPEDVISRIPFAAKLYRRELEYRLGVLAEQGVKIDARDYNAVKRAAMQETLRESKRTFYNITRYSNPVYAARYLLVYPQAVFNTMWRAARLAYRKPGTAMVMNSVWTQGFTSIGVDKEGNPTNDYSKVDSLLIPIPEQWQQNAAMASVSKLPASAFQLLSDRQGFNWTAQIPLQTIISNQPSTSTLMEKALGPELFKMAFPFGIPSGLNDYKIGPVPVGAWIPNYIRSLDAAFSVTGAGKDKHTRIANQILDYQAATGQKIDPKKAAEQATNYWTLTAALNANIPGGGGSQVIGQIERDGIRRILSRYGGNEEAALGEIMATYPNLMDPLALTGSSSEYRAYLPSTVAAFEVVSDKSLAPLISEITRNGDGNPEMVGLLVADKQGAFDPNVYDSYDQLVLPGDNDPVRDRPDPYVKAGRIEASAFWDIYNQARVNLMAEVARRGLRSVPRDLQEQWNGWFDSFIAQPGADTWYAQWGERDVSTAYRAVDTFQMALDDKNMAKYQDSSYWNAVRFYMTNLPNAIAAYKAAGSSEERASVADQWDTWVYSNLAPMDGNFVKIYDRYLAGNDVEL